MTFLFTYYRYLIFKKVFGNNVRFTESCKDAVESSHTALIFFLFPNGLGKSVGSVSCIISVPRSHVFKNPGVVIFNCNPSAGEVKTRRFLVPITS